MLRDNHRILAQLPTKMPSQRPRPTTKGRSHALSSNSRIRPVASSVSRSIVRSAFLATRREFAPSRPSSLAVNSSTCRRSLSSRLWSLSVKSFARELLSIQFSFQPPPVPALRVQRGDVVLALARHFEARLPQGGDDIVHDSAPRLARHAGAGSPGSGRGGRIRAGARRAAAPPRRRRGVRVAAPWHGRGRRVGSSRARG